MSTESETEELVPAGVPRPRRTLKPGPRPWLQPALVVGGGLPGVLLAVEGARGRLGANPISEALNAFGLLALVLLVASLACTPVRAVTGVAWIQPLRRTFGLLGFFYAALHFLLYVAVDQGLALKAIATDVAKRPFITVGMLAFALLLPLAWTSTKVQVARLGGARWRRLHKLAYVIVPLGVLHFVLRVKKDLTEPLVFGAIVAVLLGARVVLWMRKRSARPSAS